MDSLIKSKQRVQQYGEVFTPSWMVQKMLDTPGVKEASENIYATFLEPAAGDGNFLLAILERKLQAVVDQYDEKHWKTKSLIALSSIYGIELLEDNLEVARSRMFLYYLDWYEKYFGTRLSSRSDIYQSAHYLIYQNIVLGNTLTKRHPLTGEFIMFNEWQIVKGSPSMVKKIPFAFAELFGEDVHQSDKVAFGQLSLFDFEEDIEVDEHKQTNIQKIYQLGD